MAVTYGGTSAGTYTGYDQLGRANVSYQQTDSQNYGFTYGYDLAGELISQTYPSGRVMQTDYDSAGRVSGVKKQGTQMYYAGGVVGSGGFQYTAHGAISAMRLGNGRWERTSFNSRLQPTQIALDSNTFGSNILKLDYVYGTTTANSGNVTSQTITAGSLVLTQNYTYDALNRLASATETGGAGWAQTYDYDRFGNRAVRSGSYTPPANTSITPQSANSTDFSAFDQGTNRLSQTKFPAVLYDNAGNLNRDAAAIPMTYDAENRLKNFNNGTGQYFYDGDGRRVKKTDNTGTTVFVYNVAGQLIAEYTTGTPPAGDTSYLTTDHLGSTRLVTNSGGNVKARYDYLPFGEQIPSSVGSRSSVPGYGGADSTMQKFTQKERDTESGLDYFLARYYSSAQGRFTSADPARGSTRDPQSWNLYVYVTKNPLNSIDPFGLWKEVASGVWQWEDGDTWKSLSEKTGISKKTLKRAFSGAELGSGLQPLDVNGLSAGTAVQSYASTDITPLFAGVGAEMNRRQKASMQAIGAFAGGTALAGSGIGVGVYLGGGAFGASITTLGLSEGGGTIAGLYGTTTVATLQGLASSGGPAEVVVTNLTQAPAVGQGLSVATGEGAGALANAARAGGQIFRAQIPKALINELERVGLAFRSTTSMGGAAAGEIRFAPEAARFIVKFFK